MAIVTVTIPNAADNRYQTKIRLAIVTVRTSKSEPTLTKSSNVTLRSPERPRLVVIESRQRTFTKHAEHYFRIMNAGNEGQLHRATRPPMSKKWRRRKVPRWRVRCAPHQAIGSLIGMLGTGCLPEDLISRRLSLPATGDRRFESISLQRRVHVSRDFGLPRRGAGLSRGCVGPAGAARSAETGIARCMAPIGGNISVGPNSSTAASMRRWLNEFRSGSGKAEHGPLLVPGKR